MISVKSFFSKRGPKFTKYRTLGEAIDHADCNDTTDIVLLPPNAGNQHVDSDVEDVPDNLVGESTEQPPNFEPAGEVEVIHPIDVDEIETTPTATEAVPPKRRKKSQRFQVTWKKHHIFSKEYSDSPLPCFTDEYPMRTLATAFHDDLLETFVNQTNIYANRDKNDMGFSTMQSEILRFMGILLLSEYHRLPSESDYWSNQPDLGVPIVAESLSSKRFKKIKSMLHLVDNMSLSSTDSKMAKVLPIYNALNETFV